MAGASHQATKSRARRRHQTQRTILGLEMGSGSGLYLEIPMLFYPMLLNPELDFQQLETTGLYLPSGYLT